MYALIFQHLMFEAVLDVFYFPVWWYTKGAFFAARWCFSQLRFGNEVLAPWLWIKNIFVPMFGQYDWQGRIISFVMRLIQVVFRSAFLLVWLVFCIILFLLWILFPIALGYGLFKSLIIH